MRLSEEVRRRLDEQRGEVWVCWLRGNKPVLIQTRNSRTLWRAGAKFNNPRARRSSLSPSKKFDPLTRAEHRFDSAHLAGLHHRNC
jgi:hypothetical protein